MTMRTTLIPVLLTLAALTVQAAEDKVLTDRRPPQQLAGATRAFKNGAPKRRMSVHPHSAEYMRTRRKANSYQ